MDAEEGVFCMVLRSDLFCDRMRFPFGCVAFGCVFLSDVFCFRMCFTFGCRSGERPRPQKYWLSRDPGCPGEWRRLRIPASSFPGGCLFASETVVTLSDFGRHFATTEISAHIAVVRRKKGQNLIFQQFVVGGRISHSAGAE